MINQGKIVFSAALDDIKATHRCLTLRFAEARTRPPEVAGVLSWEGSGHEWTAVYHGQSDDMQAMAASCAHGSSSPKPRTSGLRIERKMAPPMIIAQLKWRLGTAA